ncbi:MAG: glycosyltransferase family 39 protein [Anaerolineae bacterium]
MRILRRITFLAGAAMLVTLAAQNANGSTLLLSLDVQFLLLAGGVFGVAWGLGDGKPGTWAQRAAPLRNTSIVLFLITLLALVLRLWQLETSVHYFVDELNFVSGVLDIVHARQSGEILHLTHPFHWLAAFPRIFPYWQSWGTAIAGQSYTGLRLPSAVLGTLTVPAVYLLGKNLFDKRVGIIAALLLATFPPHLHFSRLGLNNIADPLFGTLAMAFAARGLKEGRRGDFAWAGVMLGMSQYFYEGGRLVYPVVMGLWLVFSPPRRVQETEAETGSTPPRGKIAGAAS